MTKPHIHFQDKTFVLTAKGLEMVLGILPTGHLSHLYLGAPLGMAAGVLSQAGCRGPQNRGLSVYTTPDCFEVPLGHERLAYPTAYSGDFREPAFMARTESGHPRFDLLYRSHRIYGGVYQPQGLPHLRATWDQSVAHTQDEQTLEIDLFDAEHQVSVRLIYTLVTRVGAIGMAVQVHNEGPRPVQVQKAMSASLALPDNNWQWVQLSGDWTRERQITRRHLTPGRHSFGSTRGASSAQHNPFAALARPETTESQGEAFGLSLIYSGSFHQGIEVDEDHQLRWMTGLHPETFSWQLMPGETFETPQAVLGYSQEGFNGLSHCFHQLIETHIIPQRYRDRVRPLVLNNWEATYFDFDHHTLMALADRAQEIGVELFVLDDGWFSSRSDDRSGLGNWQVNEKKLPYGLKGLGDALLAKGLQFGLWLEPEMVNSDTPLFRDHPEWVIGQAKAGDSTRKSLCQARHQYVLDFSNPDLVAHIYDQVTAVLDPLPLSYIKWDMNRNLSEGYSATLPADRMGELHHRHMLGVYSLYQKISDRYPEILIEFCAAGGGRFDLGILYFAPQGWVSDNSDATSRLSIQYGTSLAYPLSAMGAHVSAVPNHQVKRESSLHYRSLVSYFGVFGLELDLLKSSEAELEALKAAIATYKDLRTLLHKGRFYRLLGPLADGPRGLYGQSHWHHHYAQSYAWCVVDEAQVESLVCHYQPVAYPNQGPRYLRVQGLRPERHYQVLPLDTKFQAAFVASGAYLMQAGLYMAPPFNGIEITHTHTGDGVAHAWKIKALSDCACDASLASAGAGAL